MSRSFSVKEVHNIGHKIAGWIKEVNNIPFETHRKQAFGISTVYLSITCAI